MKKFCIIILSLIFCISLSSCGDESNTDKKQSPNFTDSLLSYTETLNNITWTCKYYGQTGEIYSISATSVEYERTSEYYEFVAVFNGAHNLAATCRTKLSGKPVGDGWYQIEKEEIHSSSYIEALYISYVQETYPSAYFDDELEEMVFSSRTTRYEEKLSFSPPITTN